MIPDRSVVFSDANVGRIQRLSAHSAGTLQTTTGGVPIGQCCDKPEVRQAVNGHAFLSTEFKIRFAMESHFPNQAGGKRTTPAFLQIMDIGARLNVLTGQNLTDR